MSNENRFDAYKNNAKNSDRLRANRKEATVRKKNLERNVKVGRLFRTGCLFVILD